MILKSREIILSDTEKWAIYWFFSMSDNVCRINRSMQHMH